MPRTPREAFRRYEWPCPGDLLHMDISATRASGGPGTRSSTTSANQQEITTQLGYDYCHAIVDDHSRLAYAELLADTLAATVTAFTSRALAWFAARGIEVQRVLTDVACSYTHNRSLRTLLPKARSGTSSPRPTRHAGTAKSSACTRRCTANGRAASSTATAAPETAP